MHELSIAESVVRIALAHANGRPVAKVELKVGHLRQVVPAALAFAWVGIQLIRVNMPPRLLRFVDGWQNLDVDLRLVIFTLGLAGATAVIFGMLGISAEHRRKASRVHICCASAEKALSGYRTR